MVDVDNWEDQLDQLDRKGKSGGLAKNAPSEQVNDELSRRIHRLEDAVRLLIRHQRQGPDWENSFALTSDDADGNGHVIVEHELGYTPNSFVMILQANTIVGTARPAANSFGDLRFVESDATKITFQFDVHAQNMSSRRVFVVVPFRSSFVPRNPGEAGAESRFGSTGESYTEAPPLGLYTPP